MTRRTSQAPFSLFSFQDIITSVTGIVVLMLLVMALELASRKLQDPVVQQTLTREATHESLEQLESRIAALSKALEANQWDELASRPASEFQRDLERLEREKPLLEADQKRAEQRLAELTRQLQRAEEAWQARSAEQQELSKLEQQASELAQETDKLQSSSALVYRRGPHDGRQPWVVQCDAPIVLAAPLGPSSKPIRFEGSTVLSRVRQVVAWAKLLPPSKTYLVLMVRPRGVLMAALLEEELRKNQIAMGIDLIDQEQVAVDPELGAPFIEEDR